MKHLPMIGFLIILFAFAMILGHSFGYAQGKEDMWFPAYNEGEETAWKEAATYYSEQLAELCPEILTQ